MPNPIKYSESFEPNALKNGNWWIGTNDVALGPTSDSGFYVGITPPSSGYTIYEARPDDLPSIYVAEDDNELIFLTNHISNSGFTTVPQCIEYYTNNDDKMIINQDYRKIPTEGLILNLDSTFLSSYPTTGNTWYDLSLSGNNYTLSRSSDATYINKDITIKETLPDQFRMDYNLDADISGMVIESGSTNYFPDNVNYNIGGYSGMDKEILVGDGPFNLNSLKLTVNRSSIQSEYRVTLALPEGYYTNTFYVNKNSNFQRIELLRDSQLNPYGVSQQGVNVNTVSGTINGDCINKKIESFGDWWKVSYTFWASGISTSVLDYEARNFPSIIGDVFKISGMQIEPGFKSTSTIITDGSQKTRSTDIIAAKNIPFNTGDEPNSGSLFIDFDAGEYYGLFIKGLGIGLNGLSKVLFVFTPTSKKLYTNGSLIESETGTYDWQNLTTLDLVGNYTGKRIRNIICYNRPLTDDESIYLTT